MSCDKHGYTNGTFCPACDLEELARIEQKTPPPRLVPDRPSDALLPCPFCGGTPKTGDAYPNVPGMEDCGYSFVECCFVHVHSSESDEDAAAIWNRRAAAPPAEASASDGDWYVAEHSGSICIDWDRNPQRQLSLLLKQDGTVSYVAYVDGISYHGDAMMIDFTTALPLPNPLAAAPAAPAEGLNRSAAQRFMNRASRLCADLAKKDDKASLATAEALERDAGIMLRGILDTRPHTAPRVTGGRGARPLDEWHEDCGPVVWWKFPIDEPAWIGGPNDSDWPGYHTHWTPHPEIPALHAATGGEVGS